MSEAVVSNHDEWLWGWDRTPGIVSVWAQPDGRATVWRRLPNTGQLVREEERFRPWLLLDRLDDLQHLGNNLGPEDSGARVTFHGASDWSQQADARYDAVETGADGSFKFAALPSGSFRFAAARNHTPPADGTRASRQAAS